jgi:UDP:flavonoid glycosyltransferase YjiC (YdhE family)
MAVEELPIRVLVTLGPALAQNDFVAPENVVLERFVPHAAVLPQVSAMITQCGIGSVSKALNHGVPLVCIPVIGDQPDNAARVVACGAGVRLTDSAWPEQIRRALERVLTEPHFRAKACRLAACMRSEGNAAEAAVCELEAIGAR